MDNTQDISQTHLTGLSSTPYHDKLLPQNPLLISPPSLAPLTVTSETDRIYHPSDRTSPITIHTPSPHLELIRENLPDVVVWNPWGEKASKMADFEPKADGWRRMLCVEAGSVGGWVKLEGGEAWEGGVAMKLVDG
jgi:glucose-6-phosphate 1-epimerase